MNKEVKMPLWVLLIAYCLETDIGFNCYSHTFFYQNERNCLIGKATIDSSLGKATSQRKDGATIFWKYRRCFNTRDIKV